MLFALFCLDHPDKSDLRLATRSQHIDYIDASGAMVKVAGPLLSDDGNTMIGSFLVLDVVDRAQAEHWQRNDPYTKAGLFQSVMLYAWKPTFGALTAK